VKRNGIAVVLLLCSFLSLGQEDTWSLDDFTHSAEQWAQENLDEDVLRLLNEVDRNKVEQFFGEIQQRFTGEYVVDLASLITPARTILPLLEGKEETQPYAAWLKTRLDYLEVAEEVRRTFPPPEPQPGRPPLVVPNPAPDTEREIWVRRLAGRPWPKAATNYVPRLKPIFTAQKVPPELVWIAEVESSFDPRARSPAGAVGLFQLMPATARRFGLKTWPLDHRLRPDASARAASKYLANLHSQFKDWRLVLAAYNAGEGTVHKLLQQRKARTFDAIATRLPAETQMFVPKVEATLARREGVKLGQLRLPRG